MVDSASSSVFAKTGTRIGKKGIRFAPMGLFATFLFFLIPVSAQATAGKVGDMVPNEAPLNAPVNGISGETVNIGDALGKKVIMLEFWSIYCVSCVQEMPYLVEIFLRNMDQKYKAEDKRFKEKGVAAYNLDPKAPPEYKGLVTYSIDLDSFSPKRVTKFVEGLKFKIPYPVIVDANRDIANAFKVGMLPTTIVIGKDGKVKLYHIGFKPGDEKEIEELIKSELAK